MRLPVGLKHASRTAAVLAALIGAMPAAAVVEFQWWHAMPGELGRVLDKLAADFNNQQHDFRVVPVYKGPYTETMTAALFALRAGQGSVLPCRPRSRRAAPDLG